MRQPDTQIVAPPAEIDPPATIDPAFRAIGARVEALLRRGSSDGVNRLLDGLLTDTAASRFNERDRARFLLFLAAGVAARRSRRLKTMDFSSMLAAEMRGQMGETPQGVMIERHKNLLARLVIRGCERRGEIPHRSSYKKPSCRKGATDANA